MNDYERGQRDLISYIRASVMYIAKTSKGDDLVLDLVNLLTMLSPLKKPDDDGAEQSEFKDR